MKESVVCRDSAEEEVGERGREEEGKGKQKYENNPFPPQEKYPNKKTKKDAQILERA